MREQPVQGDATLVSGGAGKEAADGVGGAQLSHLLEAQDGGGRELLGDRAEVVDRRGVGANAGGDVGHAVTARQDHLGVAHDEHAAGIAEVFEAPHVLVDARDNLRVGGRHNGGLGQAGIRRERQQEGGVNGETARGAGRHSGRQGYGILGFSNEY